MQSEYYKRWLDARLDEALEETFPASDPIAVTPPRIDELPVLMQEEHETLAVDGQDGVKKEG